VQRGAENRQSERFRGEICDNLKHKVMAFIKMKRTHSTQVVEAWNNMEFRRERRVQRTCTGRIEPYVAIDPAIPVQERNQAMLEAAIAMGERGPDTQIQRRGLSGREHVSSKRWVKGGDRFQAALGSKIREVRRLHGVP